MNVFAKTVVRNQAVSFSLTSHTISVPERYVRIFPKSDTELMEMLSASAAAPFEDCVYAELFFPYFNFSYNLK